MGWLKAIGRFFRSLFSDRTRKHIENLTVLALPVVERIATLTPTRTDDEIVAAYKRYHKEGILDPTKPVSVLLRDLAVAVLRDMAGMTYPSRILILAVELAYNAYRDRRGNSIPEIQPGPAALPAAAISETGEA